jgi:HK97 family phage major capsid protein
MSKTRLTPGVRDKLARAGYCSDHVGRSFNAVRTPPAPGATDDVDDLTIPDSADGFAEFLADRKRMVALLAQPEKFDEFIVGYAGKVLDKQVDIRQQVDDQVTQTLANWLREQDEAGGVERLSLRTPEAVVAQGAARNGLHNPRAMGAVLDKEFTNSADFFSLIWHNRNRDAQAQAKLHKVRNAFSSTVPSEGGFLIPEALRSELLRVALETSVVRQRARVIPMETLRVPFPAIDSTSNVSSVYGGIVGFWTEEGAALQASQASFGRIVLDAKKLTAYTEVPNELISDSIVSFQAFIDEIFPEALGFYEDVAFLTGTGVGEPLGVLNGSGLVNVTRAGGGNAIDFADVIAMYARMLPGSLSRAVWVASIDTFPSLASMVVGANISPAVWLNNGQVIDGPPMTLLGRPVIFTEKVPPAGTAGDLSFIDFGFYLIGDRQVMSAMSSPHFKFQNDMTAYRIIERVDGRPWLNSAITPKNGGPTLSPYVRLV